MTVEAPGTCAPWAATEDVCAPCNDYEFDLVLLADMLQVASDVLYNFTRRRWAGVCEDSIRPCGYRTAATWSADGRGWCGCGDSRDCGCSGLSEVQLPGYPVQAISEVRIDGAVLDAGEYRLDDHRWLVRLPDGTGARHRWPCCQRIDLADTEPDTWSVTYEFGQAPPRGGVRMAARLGCQLALACNPDTLGQCQLPKRVTSVVRQGVTIGAIDPLTLFKDGLTGLADVDLWVASENRGVAGRRATVMVPGRNRAARRTGTPPAP